MLICLGAHSVTVCPKTDILYPRATPKLSDKNTEAVKVKCPYLSDTYSGKVCSLMIRQGLDGELDEFDIAHYCKGNPNHCYFYRSYSARKTAAEQLVKDKPKKLQVVFYDKLSKLELGGTEIPISGNEPLHFELIKKGFRHRVKPELLDSSTMTIRRNGQETGR